MNDKKAPVIIGCDHAAFGLKEKIKTYLCETEKISVEDAGAFNEVSVDYPDFGSKVALAVSRGAFERGILICGTGIGMSMVANRYPFVRAALCNDLFSAMMCRRHNDANILCIPARFVRDGDAEKMLDIFMNTAFEGGRHVGRVNKIACTC